MLDLALLKPGLKGTDELKVQVEHTAPSIGSGLVPVLATPVMINLIEAAALDAAERYLPDGHRSLGTHLDIRHIAATPIGMKVRATAEVTAVEGRNISFRVVPTDKARQILSVIPDNRKELVVIPNAVHDTTYNAAPALYARTVLSFLDRSIREIRDSIPIAAILGDRYGVPSSPLHLLW